jgi:hypothetical protein
MSQKLQLLAATGQWRILSFALKLVRRDRYYLSFTFPKTHSKNLHLIGTFLTIHSKRSLWHLEKFHLSLTYCSLGLILPRPFDNRAHTYHRHEVSESNPVTHPNPFDLWYLCSPVHRNKREYHREDQGRPSMRSDPSLRKVRPTWMRWEWHSKEHRLGRRSPEPA